MTAVGRFGAAIEMPEVRGNGDRNQREHDVGEKAAGVTLCSECIDDGAETRRNDETAERAESADETRRASDRLWHIFRHHLKHRRIADPHAEGDQQFAGESLIEVSDEGEDQRADKDPGKPSASYMVNDQKASTGGRSSLLK